MQSLQQTELIGRFKELIEQCRTAASPAQILEIQTDLNLVVDEWLRITLVHAKSALIPDCEPSLDLTDLAHELLTKVVDR
jgi:hypothetical protein